jgi:REP element-mobilizing transposase RayT
MTQFDPKIHHRRSIRLKEFDYSLAGAYFITICTYNRQPFFGKIVRAGENPARMETYQFGQIAYEQWIRIPERFAYVELGEFVIMPNHVHGILIIEEIKPAVEGNRVEAFRSCNQKGCPCGDPIENTKRKNVGDIVGTYKSMVATLCLKICQSKNGFMGKLWQRNYYEHIIRDEKTYLEITRYILENPAKWEMDSLFFKG